MDLLRYAQAGGSRCISDQATCRWGFLRVATDGFTTAERAFAGCTRRAAHDIKGNFGHR